MSTPTSVRVRYTIADPAATAVTTKGVEFHVRRVEWDAWLDDGQVHVNLWAHSDGCAALIYADTNDPALPEWAPGLPSWLLIAAQAMREAVA